MSRKIVGRIREVYCYESIGKAKFEWIIPDFVSHPKGQWRCAPTFRCLGVDWNVDIHDLMYIMLRAVDIAENATSLLFTVGMKKTDGSEEVLLSDRRVFEGGEGRSRHLILEPPQFERLRPQLPKGKITITCTIFGDEKPPPRNKSVVCCERQTEKALGADGRTDQLVRVDLEEKSCLERQTEKALGADDRTDDFVQLDLEDVSLLRDHFKNLLLFGDDHDVTIAVQNKQFKAHKYVLRARSPVFEAMFRSKMKESSEGTVSIDDCDPEVFGKFLRYVYTAKVDIQSVSQAVGLYYAGDKYDFPILKRKSIAFLMTSFSTTTISDVVTLAATHSEEELMQKAVVYFSQHIEEIMVTVEWQRFLFSNPIQANEINLKAVQCLKASYTKNDSSVPMN